VHQWLISIYLYSRLIAVYELPSSDAMTCVAWFARLSLVGGVLSSGTRLVKMPLHADETKVMLRYLVDEVTLIEHRLKNLQDSQRELSLAFKALHAKSVTHAQVHGLHEVGTVRGERTAFIANQRERSTSSLAVIPENKDTTNERSESRISLRGRNLYEHRPNTFTQRSVQPYAKPFLSNQHEVVKPDKVGTEEVQSVSRTPLRGWNRQGYNSNNSDPSPQQIIPRYAKPIFNSQHKPIPTGIRLWD